MLQMCELCSTYPCSMINRVIQKCKLRSKGSISPHLTNRVCSTDHMRWQMAPPKLLVTPLKLLAHYCSPRSLHQYIQCAQHFSPDRQRNQCHVKVSARAVRENGATYLSQIDHYADRLARCWRWAGNDAKGSLHRRNFAMDSLLIDRSADRRWKNTLRRQNHALYQIRWHTRDPNSRCPTVTLGRNCSGMTQIFP